MTIVGIKAKTIEDNRLYGIETMNVIIRSGHVISYISNDDMGVIVNNYLTNEPYPGGLFITGSEADGFTVCDADCDCYFEDYIHESVAIRWLIRDYNSLEELIAADK